MYYGGFGPTNALINPFDLDSLNQIGRQNDVIHFSTFALLHDYIRDTLDSVNVPLFFNFNPTTNIFSDNFNRLHSPYSDGAVFGSMIANPDKQISP